MVDQVKPATGTTVAGASATPNKKLTWAEMTVAQRTAFKQDSMGKAVEAVKHGARAGIQVKVGDHTLTLRPTGVSERGSVAYGYKPSVILYEGQRLRINKISFSIINDQDTSTGDVDWDNLTAS